MSLEETTLTRLLYIVSSRLNHLMLMIVPRLPAVVWGYHNVVAARLSSISH